MMFGITYHTTNYRYPYLASISSYKITFYLWTNHLGMDWFKSCFPCAVACMAGLCVLRPDGWGQKVRDLFGLRGHSLSFVPLLSNTSLITCSPLLLSAWKARIDLLFMCEHVLSYLRVWTVVIFCSSCHKYSLSYDINPSSCEFTVSSCISNKSDLAAYTIYSSHGDHQAMFPLCKPAALAL